MYRHGLFHIIFIASILITAFITLPLIKQWKIELYEIRSCECSCALNKSPRASRTLQHPNLNSTFDYLLILVAIPPEFSEVRLGPYF